MSDFGLFAHYVLNEFNFISFDHRLTHAHTEMTEILANSSFQERINYILRMVRLIFKIEYHPNEVETVPYDL